MEYIWDFGPHVSLSTHLLPVTNGESAQLQS
jgi:hypothetical protein